MIIKHAVNVLVLNVVKCIVFTKLKLVLVIRTSHIFILKRNKKMSSIRQDCNWL